MQVITELKENRSHNIKDAGAYEWWYFDCIDSDNEYSFNAIFLTGNPFSPDYNRRIKYNINNPGSKKPDPMDFCAISFNLYLHDRVLYKILYEFEKESFRVETDRGIEKISLDRNNFYFEKNENRYYLSINLPDTNINNQFKAEFVFTVISDTEAIKKSGSGSREDHFWLPAASVCEVTGKFKFYRNFKRAKTEITGYGYHDHNWGNEAMFRNIKDWYCGRVITNNYSAVYNYIIYKEENRKPFKALYIFKEGKLTYEYSDFEIILKNKKNFWLLNFSKSIIITKDDIKLVCRYKDKIDNGLSYERYFTRADLFEKGVKIISGATGFSGDICPDKFRSGLLKQLAGLRKKKRKEIK